MYQRQKKNARYYIIKHFVYLFIFCCIIWFLPSSPQAVTNVTRKTMYIGDSYTLKINGKIRDGNWTSSNPRIASVIGKGRIRAKSNGRTTITVQIGKKKYHCVITVRIPVQAIIPNEGWVDLDGPKKKFKLKATLYPQNAYNKKLTFKSTDESIAIVSKNGTITALSNGTCKIKITAADRNKLSRYCYVCVTGCTMPVIQKSDYKYEVYLLDGLDKDDWYAEYSRVIYIKTDNPDINSLDWKTSNGVYKYVEGVRRFADVNYLEIRDDLEVARVDGGYIMSIGFSDPGSGDTLFGVCKGKNYINLMENSKCVASIPCKIKEYETEYKKAVKEIVRQSSAAGMDPFERMQAAVDYIEKKHPRYLANDGTYLYTFAAEPSDELWFKSWRFDSLTTPTILCSIAKEIGGFDKISNLYYDGNWSEHWYARVTIGNQSKDYTFCPDVSTGDIGEIQKINFMDTSKMTKIY